jgi:hypothetical protein
VTRPRTYIAPLWGANGQNRSLAQTYTPHPRAVPCARCRTWTDPQDADYTRAILGRPVCIACLRALEAEVRYTRGASRLDAVQAQVEANPRLLEPDYGSG